MPVLSKLSVSRDCDTEFQQRHQIVYTRFSDPSHQSLITSASSGPSRYPASARICSRVLGRWKTGFKRKGLVETVLSVRKRIEDRFEQVQDEGA